METLEIVLIITSSIETIALALIAAIWGNTPVKKEKRKTKRINKNISKFKKSCAK